MSVITGSDNEIIVNLLELLFCQSPLIVAISNENHTYVEFAFSLHIFVCSLQIL